MGIFDWLLILLVGIKLTVRPDLDWWIVLGIPLAGSAMVAILKEKAY